MLSVCLAYAAPDASVAQEIRAFIESGCDSVCFAPDSLINDRDLFTAADFGLSEDVLVVLLSPASNPARWPRNNWEPFLLPQASQPGHRIAIFLLQECVFPVLLRRGARFFDATAARRPALRQLKRWLGNIELGNSPGMTFSSDLEELYRALADVPGTLTVPGAIAKRFAQQAAQDFQGVFWIPASGRTLTQIAGEIGSQLRMTLDGPPADNFCRLRGVLSNRRCLLVLDGSHVALDPILPSGRTSILFTSEPVETQADQPSLAAARGLVSAGRLAEAYELLYQLFDSQVEPQSCARELIRICEHWDRTAEANALRFHLGPAPSEQLRLF